MGKPQILVKIVRDIFEKIVILNGLEGGGFVPGNWIDLAEDRDQWRAYIRAVMNLRVP